jgi:hypothetical protein
MADVVVNAADDAMLRKRDCRSPSIRGLIDLGAEKYSACVASAALALACHGR